MGKIKIFELDMTY